MLIVWMRRGVHRARGRPQLEQLLPRSGGTFGLRGLSRPHPCGLSSGPAAIRRVRKRETSNEGVHAFGWSCLPGAVPCRPAQGSQCYTGKCRVAAMNERSG